MKINKNFAAYSSIPEILALLLISFVAAPDSARAQVNGNKAVYGLNRVSPSQVWIDASAFCGSYGCSNPQHAVDFCAVLNDALQTLPPQGAVVDARGIVPSSMGSQTCGGNPWGNPYTSITAPSTVLLPASTINITATWTLPNNTKISGEGRNTILTAIGSFSGTAIISMGSSESCPSEGCSGVAVEHLKLMDSSNGGLLNGIVNAYSQTPSYVNDVSLNTIGGTGLVIGGPLPGAIDSGPYSNIDFNANLSTTCNGTTCPLCVDIETQTRGLHGITCIGNPNASNGSTAPTHAAIWVNASNNTIDDVHTEGFWDSVQIGPANTVSNIVVSNVTGGNSKKGHTANTIHICGANSNQTFGPCIGSGSASDVTILDVQNAGATSVSVTSIQDDVTGTSIAQPAGGGNLIPSYAAVYFLGQSIGGAPPPAYSRFSTNPSVPLPGGAGGTVVPTWGVGAAIPVGTSCNTPGALYSDTGGASNQAVLVCTGTSTFKWQTIP